MDIEGKVAIVTGASGAIGSAVASVLADGGAKVVVHSHSRGEEGEKVAASLRANGRSAIHFSADLRQSEGANATVEAACAEFGAVDILICASGATVGGGEFVGLSVEDWESAFSSNVLTTTLISEAFANKVNEQKSLGRIVITSSVRGLSHCGREAIMAYSIAKGALLTLVGTLAKDLGPEILVNGIAPGFVYTPNYEAMTDELKDSFTSSTVIGRFIQPNEIARVYADLVRTDIITGQTVVVDGGFSLKRA